MFVYSSKTALITGASSGIGEAFAYALARRGTHLVLVARSKQRLETLAAELRARHGVRVEVVSADLTAPGAVERIRAQLQDRELHVDLLINNAGFGTYGAFDTLTLPREREQITLNVASLVELTHTFLPGMLARADGGVINVASTAGFQACPHMATYGATKAFVLSFSEALWAENHRRGVTVTALCPGPTETAFFASFNGVEPDIGPKVGAETVVAAGLKAFERGRSYVIPGRRNYWLAQLSRWSSRRLTALIAERMLRPKASGNVHSAVSAA
ncbi:MAG: SDR family oxidoreductase [Myxococcota bacterium]